MSLPDVMSVHSKVEGELEDWRSSTRGSSATDVELKELGRFLFFDDPMTMSPERQIQVTFQWLDLNLPSPYSNPSRVFEPYKSGLSLADIENHFRALGLSIDGGREMMLDLWLEGECLEPCIQTAWRMLGRWKGLRATLVAEQLSEKSRAYLRDAAQAYLFGQFKAAVALSRASLEVALKERLPGVPLGADMSLKELIGRASQDRILAGRYSRLANKVREAGNQILHVRGEANEASAGKILQHTGELFEHLFKPR